MTKRLSRRHLLRGAGGVAIGLPFLAAMDHGRVKAADSGKPKRLVVMYSPNGFNTFPTSKDLSNTPLAPLARHQELVNVMRGVDMKSAKVDPVPLDRSHYLGWGHLLTGDNVLASNVSGSISFDMLASNRIGGVTQLPYSLHGIPHDEGQSPLSWRGSGQAAQAEIRPDRAFTKLFAGLNVNPAEQQSRLVQQKSVLDYVKDSIQRTQCELGQSDRERLEHHLDSIRDVEARLGLTGGGMSCAVPPAPGTGLNYPAIGKAQRELLAMAFACDLTRVGSLQYSHVAGGGTPTWLGITETHHELSHRQDPDGLRMMGAIGAWYAEELAQFVDLLKGYKDSDGASVMDNTVIVWVSECGFPGYDHIGDLVRNVNLGIVTVGSAGGALKTNQYLDVGGAPHQNLWVELVNAVSPDDLAPITTFGNATTCTGGLKQLRV